jgi:PhzF family phenazine biosynthesis protein
MVYPKLWAAAEAAQPKHSRETERGGFESAEGFFTCPDEVADGGIRKCRVAGFTSDATDCMADPPPRTGGHLPLSAIFCLGSQKKGDIVKLRQYQVDAFARHVFEGNPAAVVPLVSWLDDAVLQAIAEENNLAETAFFVPSVKGFHLRWFTPTTEVDLCGHATLATAHVLFEHLGHAGLTLTFETRSGDLMVQRQGKLLVMDFPARPPSPCPPPEALPKGLGQHPVHVLAADDYVVVFDSEAAIRSIRPDHAHLGTLDLRGVIVTAPGQEVDFVSRFFAPKYGIPEDPVTGSAHCALAPYWAARLGKTRLQAKQLSKRGGEVLCEVNGNRVMLSGRAVTFMEAECTI